MDIVYDKLVRFLHSSKTEKMNGLGDPVCGTIGLNKYSEKRIKKKFGHTNRYKNNLFYHLEGNNTFLDISSKKKNI